MSTDAILPEANNCPSSDNEPICPEHQAYLAERGVPLDTAVKAGLRCVGSDEGADRLGTAAPAGLLIPYSTPDPYVRLRSCAAAILAGTPKFLAPKGRAVELYIPPSADLSSPEQIVVTEGPVKALALNSAGFFAVGLGGVDTTLVQGTAEPTLAPTWDTVQVRGRRVVVLFDAGRRLNPRVARAEARLVIALERAGADVVVAELPLRGGAHDQGPDDFLAAQGLDALRPVIEAARVADPVVLAGALDKGALLELLDDLPFLHSVLERSPAKQAQVEERFRSVHQLKRLRDALGRARRGGRGEAPDTDDRTNKYEVNDGGFCFFDARGGRVVLTNFVARVVEEAVPVPTASCASSIVLEGTNQEGVPLRPFRTTWAALTNEAWVYDAWGAAVRIAGEVSRAGARLREAIIEHSEPRRVELVDHIGWTVVGGEPVFVHDGGVIGGREVHPVLDASAARYKLPERTEDLATALMTALSFLDIAPTAVTGPLFAAIWRAPTLDLFPVDLGIHVVGASGTRKTTLVELMLAFFGVQSSGTMQWSSTRAAIETHLHRCKDVIVEVDDLVPRSADHNDPDRQKFTAVVRSIGNRAARCRMNRDMSAQPNRPPRGLVVSTGEDVAGVQSVIARLLLIEITASSLHLDRLSELQAKQQILPMVTRAYIEWLTPRLAELRERLPRRHAELRVELNGRVTGHARAPGRAAHLLLGLELFGQFISWLSEDIRAGIEPRLPELRDAIIAACGQQHGDEAGADPVTVFLETLRDLIATRQLAVIERGGVDRESPILVRDADLVYADPARVYASVRDQLRSIGGDLHVSLDTLVKRLVERGDVVPERPDRHRVRVLIGGRRQRRLAFRATSVLDEDGGRTAWTTSFEVPVPSAVPGTGGGIGRFSACGPIGPVGPRPETHRRKPARDSNPGPIASRAIGGATDVPEAVQAVQAVPGSEGAK